MKEYLLIYRGDYEKMPQSPEQMQVRTQKWMDWIAGIAARNSLADRGNRLMNTGKLVKSEGIITDGPFTEIKEAIMGYSILKAASYEEATQIAKDCPIFLNGGNVEVREISAM